MKKLLCLFVLLVSFALWSTSKTGEVEKKGQTSRIVLDSSVSGHLSELNGRYKLRATETTYAPGGFIGDHHHAGPGIRYVAGGELTYVQPDKTTLYKTGDYFYESGDITHSAVNKTELPVKVINFELLPVDWTSSSAIPATQVKQKRSDFSGGVAAESQDVKTLVLEKNEGEKRVRRPRGSLPIPTNEFTLKVTPQNSGSKHLVLGTEDIPPGGIIPRHKHLEQDEILLIQTGTAHVTLDDKEYDVHAGSTVFFPAQTWVSLKNIGKDAISLVFIFSAPGFEENMRCGSVPAGQSAPPITTDELKTCAHKGHVEYEALEPGGKK
jgi:quercetin dioxygenase-like cupin family protein